MLECFFHGHSFIEIMYHNNQSLIIDPFVTENKKCELSIDQVLDKNISTLILTHGHYDHIGDTLVIAQAYPELLIIAPIDIINWLQTQGIKNPMQPLEIGESRSNEELEIKFVSAIHDGAILETGLQCTPVGVIININGKSIYHAGDTALTPDMQKLSEYKIDLSFLPIGGFYTMDATEALIAASWIKSKIVVPIHYNTFPKIKADDMEFARQLMLNKYATPKVLKPGQSVILE